MAQDMNDPNFKQKCAAIWPAYANNTTIDRFHEKIAVHAKSVFLGYADLTLGLILQGGHVAQWKLRGVEVKMLNGKAHLDMPSDKGADGNYYPQFFPKTAEDREIVTTLVFSSEAVKTAIENAQRVIDASNTPEPASTELPASVDAGAPAEGSVGATVANPFAEEAA